MGSSGASAVRTVGRYVLCDEIAHGGMATVHLGRLVGTAGFARTVAIKRLHPQYAKDPDFVAMFVDEARLAARIHHPNVVSTLDVVAEDGELLLVMEYVQGESLARLERLAAARGERIPRDFAASILVAMLYGLHAAHEAKGERGEPLGIVHRDVSPQNVLVGTDGVARVLDFGVAKGAGRIQTTRDGQLKGKLAYMPPEQLRGEVARTTDVYAAGVILWEALTGTRLFKGDNEGVIVTKVMLGCSEPPSARVPGISPELDAITLRALSRDPHERFATARDMARAIEDVVPAVAASKVGEWVSALAASTLLDRQKRVEAVESNSAVDAVLVRGHAARVNPGPPSAGVPVHEDSAVTQVATASSAGSLGRTTTGTGRAVVLSSGAVLLLGFLALLRFHGTNVSESPPPAAASPAAPSATPVAPSPSVVASQPSQPPATSSAPVPAPPISASSPPAVVRATRPTSKPTSPATGAPHNARCDPPYFIDAEGVRTYKKECL